VLVAPQFARALDTDADGTLSAPEIDVHVEAIRSAVTAQVDGRAVDMTLTEHRYPAMPTVGAPWWWPSTQPRPHRRATPR
jgi:hypothetical protein